MNSVLRKEPLVYLLHVFHTAVILFILLDFSFEWNAEVLSAGTTITLVQTSFVNQNVHQITTTRQQNH